MTTIAVGAKAPSFSLPNQNNEVVYLSDFSGKWLVLYFYPKDDTPGCTVEACNFRTTMQSFTDLRASVVGVSADSPEDHKAFVAKYDLNFDLLSDSSKEMLEAYGVWGEQMWQGTKYMGIRRETYLLNPEGNVAYHWPNVRPDVHAQEVRAKITQLS